ncbi:ATP-dependent DNA helicase RecQ [Clavibacter sp. B3I6]|uniref:RecQ family ATP-dependent DNA helicase n=1 Tax=Clavibacter sp. B3I6 TaxID=3042268 RepID=UPI002789E17A|nr:RecQ family ATP-dependent DNA helicase [Clavibacter sp. B3I6]MDQ0744780.1 ATP-dependent DNA helicase RecQ [Clavibacter sp. B3I6]
MKQNRTAESPTRTTDRSASHDRPDEDRAAADPALLPEPTPGPGPDDAVRVAREAFGWDDLLDGQLRTIGPLVRGRDALVVMPTGYGKSAIYQVATVLMEGLTVVVSPLIALQADQVQNLEDAPAAPPARVINGTIRGKALEEAWATVEEPGARIVFLTPEQLARDEVVERLVARGVSLVVIDEAHCVASWGHDFRPDYLGLGGVIDALGHPPTVAMTATGSTPVRTEIEERLGLRDPFVLSSGFDRPNIRLEVRRHTEESEKRRAIVAHVGEQAQPGLVYVATRKDAEQYAEEIQAAGLRTAAYHAGLPAAERDRVQTAFHEDDVDVVVATSAFGMGIDKPTVRYVIHAAPPESVDAYYQEVGRAGRDGEPAVGILHYRAEDLGLRRFFAARTPRPASLRDVYAAVAVAGADGPVRPAAVAERAGMSARTVGGVLHLLVDAGVLGSDRDGAYVTEELDPREAASRAKEVAEERERIEVSRLEMMRGYAETMQCRRQYLLGYFGEDSPVRCGNCDVCDRLDEDDAHEEAMGTADAGEATEEATEDASDDRFPPQSQVTHAEWGPGTVMSTEEDRLTVFFEKEGYRVLSRKLVEDGDLLQPA